jgi:hypothetical protein
MRRGEGCKASNSARGLELVAAFAPDVIGGGGRPLAAPVAHRLAFEDLGPVAPVLAARIVPSAPTLDDASWCGCAPGNGTCQGWRPRRPVAQARREHQRDRDAEVVRDELVGQGRVPPRARRHHRYSSDRPAPAGPSRRVPRRSAAIRSSRLLPASFGRFGADPPDRLRAFLAARGNWVLWPTGEIAVPPPDLAIVMSGGEERRLIMSRPSVRSRTPDACPSHRAGS